MKLRSKMTPVLPVKGYCAIRQNEDHAWIDFATFSGSPEVAQGKAAECDHRIPQWAKANPVMRIAPVTITEVTE